MLPYTYKNAQLSQTFTAKNRATAIKQAIEYLKTKKDNPDLLGKHYRWEAEDGNGFILELTIKGQVELYRRINAN